MISKNFLFISISILFLVFSFKSAEAGFFGNIIGDISDGINAAVDAVDGVVDDAVDAVDGVVDDAVDGVNDLVNDGKKIVVKTASKLSDFTTKTYDEAKEKVEDLIKNIQNQTVLNALKSEIKQIVSDFASNTGLSGCLKKKQCSFCQDVKVNSIGIDTKGNKVAIIIFN